LEAWDSAAVVDDMLFADKPGWYLFAIAVGDGYSECSFAFVDALGVVSECAVAEIAHHFFASIEPVVDFDVVFWCTAEFAG